jgi:hypothetical protein
MQPNPTPRNPFRPGAGHRPVYLAGRRTESAEFQKLLKQDVVLANMILTGLRGVGKTVLLEELKPKAIIEGWLWAGTDLSESSSITEDSFATRILTDLSLVTSSVVLTRPVQATFFRQDIAPVKQVLDFRLLRTIFDHTPGLVADKLKHVLVFAWTHLRQTGKRGIVFAYDEAQNLSDHSAKEQFPLSLMLDVFQSLQRQEFPFLLVLTGLPTLLPKLVEARTYSERMFHVVTLGPLTVSETREAIEVPIRKVNCPFTVSSASIDRIWDLTRGYPYLVQYVCREAFDIWMQNIADGRDPEAIPEEAILQKLDADFFAGRWARATDRQRELLTTIAWLENSDSEFTVQEIADKSHEVSKRPFSSSHVNQMLAALTERGLVYKNRHGKYLFAVPLFNKFIMRQLYGSAAIPPPLDEDAIDWADGLSRLSFEDAEPNDDG